MLDDFFIDKLPTLDLHGLDRDTARVAVNDFILENIKLKNEKIVIIHGIGLSIIKNEVHNLLKHHKNVETYKQHLYNIGCTIVKLKI